MTEAMNHIEVGDLFCSSWGYEQTNVDFYVVIRKMKSMIELAPVGTQSVEETGWASDRVKADLSRVGEERLKRRPSVYDFGGTVKVCVGIDRVSAASKVPHDYTAHRSWYA